MFSVFKNAWKVPDIRKKIIFTLIIILLFRIGSAIPVPFFSASVMKELFSSDTMQGSLFGYFNMLSGDSFAKGNLFALSISPYITASIVIQLLTVAFPKSLGEIAKSGPEGQKKINKITRLTTIGLAIITAIGYYLTIKSYDALTDESPFAAIVIVTAYTAGAMIVMWLGEKIDDNGIGNGISVLLFVNIVSSFPSMFTRMWAMIHYNGTWNFSMIPWIVILLLIMLATIVFVVVINEAERRLPVQYAKRTVGRKMYGGMSTNLPIKVMMAGVLPVIFAQAIVSLPATLAQLIPSWRNSEVLTKWFTASTLPGGAIYALVYFVLIILFAYFYISTIFDPVEVSNNLKKNGGTIMGYRPGKPTADYIRKVLNRVTLMGAIALSIMVIIPIMLAWTGIAVFTNFTFGGTSIIIVVGVAIETTRDLESQITMRHYKGFLEA